MSGSDGGIAFGPFLLDLARGELIRAGELVPLAPKPLALLGYLAANRDRAVPKHELRKQVWPDVFVSEAALASALKDLRRALGDDGARQSVIRTLRRRGYRFVAKLDERPADRARAAEARAGSVIEPPKTPPFVSRGRELRALTSAVAQAGRGRPRVVLISGEAGSGKTRLLEQLLAHPVCAGFAAAVGRCRADASLPYLAFAEALGAHLLESEESTEHVLGEDAHILRPLLQPDAPTLTPADPMDPGQPLHERADLFAAVWKLLGRFAQRRPLLLALEDLHGADESSLELFGDLVAAASEAPADARMPLLIVATTRPPRAGERLELALQRAERQSAFSAVAIGGLGLGGTRRLVGSLGLARPSEPTLRAIQQTTDGNPLYIREVIREADRSGVLHVADAGETYRASVSDGLRAALAARIARLDPDCRASLEAAAFIGDRFGALAVSAVCGADAETTRAHLQAAVRAELLIPENRSFRFEHPLIREILCEDTPEPVRREIHRDVAAVLEDLYATAPGEHALEIARHLVEAGSLVEPERLVQFARRAGDQASAVFAWSEAARFYYAAVDAAAELPARERALLHLRAGFAANHAFHVDRCLHHYARAAEDYEAARDDVGLAWSLMYLTRARLTSPTANLGGDSGVTPLEELVNRFGETHPVLRALLLETLSLAHWTAGNVAGAEAAAERAIALGSLYDDDVVCHHGYVGLGLAQLSQLRVGEALDSWLESAARARRAHDPWLQAVPGPRIVLALLLLGRLDEARERGRAAAEQARRVHSFSEQGFALANLAAVEAISGNLGEADELVREGLNALERSSYPWAGVLALSTRACVSSLRGRFDDASAALTELVTPGRVFEQPGPAIQFVAAAYRELIHALRDPSALDPQRIQAMFAALRAGRLDPYVLGPACALAEACVLLRDASLARAGEELLRVADAHGIAFSVGGVFLVPRVIGRCIAVDRRFDEAEAWLARATEIARGCGARVELARALLDRAKLRLERAATARNAERAARLLAEATPILGELGLQPLLREAHRLRESIDRVT